MLGRLIEVYAYRTAMDDLYHAQANYQDVQWRYLVSPTYRASHPFSPYAFNTTNLKEQIQ